MAQQLDAAGNPVGAPQTVAAAATAFAVAGLASGEWVVVWGAATIAQLNPSIAAFPYTVQAKRFSAAGAMVQDTTVLPSTIMQVIDAGMDVQPTSDGGYAVAWSARISQAGPRQILLQRVTKDGVPLTSPTIASTTSEDQTAARVVPLSGGRVMLAWLGHPYTGTSPYNVFMRPFAADGSASAAQTTLAVTTEPAAFSFAAAPLASDRVALLWAQPSRSAGVPGQVRWQLTDAAGVVQGSPGVIEVSGDIDWVDIAPAASGSGFTGFVQQFTGFNRGAFASISSFAVDANGASTGTLTPVVNRGLSSVGPVTGSSSGPTAAGFSVAGGADGHFVYAYEQDIPNGAQLDAAGK